MKSTILTIESKYIFIDIVKYSFNRSVEAQTYLVKILNEIVLKTILEKRINKTKVIYIPTGDGMCIALLEVSNPYDIHLQIALSILQKIENHNSSISDESRKFLIRIGLNENTDNLIIDINGNRNIAGSGIDLASRILNLCDANQILVGTPVFDKLKQRELYMNSFTTYTAQIKHGVSLNVHQFKNESTFLNTDTPTHFLPPAPINRKLPILIAYYFAICIKNEEFCRNKLKEGSFFSKTLTILNFYLAEYNVAKLFSTDKDNSKLEKISKDLNTAVREINNVGTWVVINDLAKYIFKTELIDFSLFFQNENFFITTEGKNKLISEYPEICLTFGIK